MGFKLGNPGCSCCSSCACDSVCTLPHTTLQLTWSYSNASCNLISRTVPLAYSVDSSGCGRWSSGLITISDYGSYLYNPAYKFSSHTFVISCVAGSWSLQNIMTAYAPGSTSAYYTLWTLNVVSCSPVLLSLGSIVSSGTFQQSVPASSVYHYENSGGSCVAVQNNNWATWSPAYGISTLSITS